MKFLPLAVVAALLALGPGAASCRATGRAQGPPAEDVRAVERTLEELYRSFCFDAGAEADWAGMRALFVDGASFVAPIRDGAAPRAVDAGEFVQDFRDWIATSPEGRSGFHERIAHRRIDLFGSVAHAYVLFEGFVPGEERARTRGIDSIQLVRHGERWLVASFTTQFANAEQPVPARFAAHGGGPAHGP